MSVLKFLQTIGNAFFDRADVIRENAEAVFAACDAAHGRWAKLFGVSALLHPRLKLQEFLSIYSITQKGNMGILIVHYMTAFFLTDF